MRTVIVRLFEPADGMGEVELSGFVDVVALGTRRRFSGAEELVAAIGDIMQGSQAEEEAPL